MKKKVISFQGLHGAYSDLVCRKFYKSLKTLPCNTFGEAILAVEEGSADLAMIPVENNIAGRVADMHFLLEKINLKIVAEFYHKIEHHLMSIKQSDIKKITKVYSHIHALSQCTKNIKKHKLDAINFIDTAGAAKFISEEKDESLAAIGSELSSKNIWVKNLKKKFRRFKKQYYKIFGFFQREQKYKYKKKGYYINCI